MHELADNEPVLCTWYGKNVDELTRDELLVAFKQMAQVHERDRQSHMSSMRLMRDLARR